MQNFQPFQISREYIGLFGETDFEDEASLERDSDIEDDGT